MVATVLETHLDTYKVTTGLLPPMTPMTKLPPVLLGDTGGKALTLTCFLVLMSSQVAARDLPRAFHDPGAEQTELIVSVAESAVVLRRTRQPE